AEAAENRRPVKKPGRPDGQRTFQNVWPGDAPKDRIRSVASGAVDANPSSRAIGIGKNVTRITTSTFGRSPNPNQTTTSGAIATIGIVWDPTRSGSTARRAQTARSRPTATAVAAAIDAENPTAVSTTVGMLWRMASSRNRHREPRTSLGAGRKNGLTPDARADRPHAARTSPTRTSGGPSRQIGRASCRESG